VGDFVLIPSAACTLVACCFVFCTNDCCADRRACAKQWQAPEQRHIDSGVDGDNSGLMQAAAAAAGQPSGCHALEMPDKVALTGQHEDIQQFQAQMPSTVSCCDSYFMDQPWQDLCFVPMGCTAMMDQLLDQLQAGSGACSSRQLLPSAREASSDGSRGSDSSSQACPASACVADSPDAASSAQSCSTDACTHVSTDEGATIVKTWCLMELPPDCVISFEHDPDDQTAQQLAAHQPVPQGSSSGFSSSKAAAVQQQQEQEQFSTAACASQYFSAAAAATGGWAVSPTGAETLGAGCHMMSAAYHTLLACGDFAGAWQAGSTLAGTVTTAPQREQQLHVHLLQQQLQQQLHVDDSYDSLAALPLENPYTDGAGGVRSSNIAAGAECFVGEF
jgi:hypothetical protein